MGKLPVAGAVADRVDMRHGRAPMVVGADSRSRCILDADSLEAEACDKRSPADRDEHQVGVDGLGVAELHGQFRSGVLDLRALLLEM
jgi:hypothetical protein